MGRIVRREYVEIPKDYWTSSCDVKYIIKEKNAKAIKRNK